MWSTLTVCAGPMLFGLVTRNAAPNAVALICAGVQLLPQVSEAPPCDSTTSAVVYVVVVARSEPASVPPRSNRELSRLPPLAVLLLARSTRTSMPTIVAPAGIENPKFLHSSASDAVGPLTDTVASALLLLKALFGLVQALPAPPPLWQA